MCFENFKMCFENFNKRFESFKTEDTAGLGLELAKKARPGGIYCLSGSLGAGKTVFAKGFAKGIGYKGMVTSPGFTLLNLYEGGRFNLYHFDLYRLPEDKAAALDALEGIGFEEYLYGNDICLIEWAERAFGTVPEMALKILIKAAPDKGETYREIFIA